MLCRGRVQRAISLKHGKLRQGLGDIHIILDKVPVGVTHGSAAVGSKDIANGDVQLAIPVRQHQIKQSAETIYPGAAPGIKFVEGFFDHDRRLSGHEREFPRILPDLDHAGAAVEFPFGASAVLVEPFGENTEDYIYAKHENPAPKKQDKLG